MVFLTKQSAGKIRVSLLHMESIVFGALNGLEPRKWHGNDLTVIDIGTRNVQIHFWINCKSMVCLALFPKGLIIGVAGIV